MSWAGWQDEFLRFLQSRAKYFFLHIFFIDIFFYRTRLPEMWSPRTGLVRFCSGRQKQMGTAEGNGDLFRFVILVLRRRHRLMRDRRGDTHFAGGQRAAKIEVIDHPISSSDKVSALPGLIRWQVKHLHPSAGDLNLVVVPVFVPFLQRYLIPG